MDLLLHNVDRVPLTASNNGNAGNVMFSKHGADDGAHVVAIDQCLNCISPERHPTMLAEHIRYVYLVTSLSRSQCSMFYVYLFSVKGGLFHFKGETLTGFLFIYSTYIFKLQITNHISLVVRLHTLGCVF